jgi:hypothetical protein
MYFWLLFAVGTLTSTFVVKGSYDEASADVENLIHM